MTKRDEPGECAHRHRGLHDAYARGLDPVHVVEQVFDAIERAGDPGIFISLADRKACARRRRSSAASIPWPSRCGASPSPSRTTSTSRDCRPRPPARLRLHAEASATAVERVIAAGALLIGKTNLDQFATGLVGVRTPYPVPRNAIDPTIVPGGSSRARPSRWRSAWCRSRSAPIPRARAACRPASTTSSA